ncbi:MAG: glycoside hydrolase family 3 N-terminal domain-containing protein, partial [Stenotrophomonas sp.]
MKTITKPLALTAAIALSLSASALAAAPIAGGAAFTVLTLEKAPDYLDAKDVAAQLQALDVDALTIGNVVRPADTSATAHAPDPLAALADQLGYTYRFVSADPAAAEQRGSIVLSRLPVEAESGVEAPGLNYLRLNDGRNVVALYTQASGAAAAPVKALVDGSRLGAPAVLLGTDADTATAAGFTAIAKGTGYSTGFNAASTQSVKLRLGSDANTAGQLLTLDYTAPTGGDTPWMDTGLTADARAKLLVARMTVDEKFQMLHSYFGLGKDGGPLPEGAVGSAGFVPGVARLGIPSQQSADAGVGVTNPGGIRKGDHATAMPSGPATASSWNPDIAFAGGATMGREAWQQRFNILLAGSVNLQRDPRNGRNFEYAGEDPVLAGRLVGESIRGVQSQHVISTMKHFALNDMETSRNFHSAEIGEQAMRESDLLAFEIALDAGKPGSVMCSYNRING